MTSCAGIRPPIYERDVGPAAWASPEQIQASAAVRALAALGRRVLIGGAPAHRFERRTPRFALT